MKRNLWWGLLCALLIYLSNSSAYEIETHAVITQETVSRTVLTENGFLQELGLDSYNNDFGLKYYDISVGDIRDRSNDIFEDDIIDKFKEKTDSLKGWFMRGAIREDDCWVPFLCKDPGNDPVNDNRPLNHFYDPYNNAGLITSRAPDWALGTEDAFISPLKPLPEHFLNLNHYSIFSAQEAMVRALSGQYTDVSGSIVSLDEIQRKAYWATTFRALGDVVHLVQDMGQPQHTRGDAHSYFNTLEQQVFEKFINARALVSNGKKFICFDKTDSQEITPLTFTLNNVSYPNPHFTKYSDFFSTSPRGNTQDGKGLADYSNRSFFTAGTNKGTAKYPSPEFNVLTKTNETFSSKCVNTNSAMFTLYAGYAVDQNNSNFSGVISLTARSMWDVDPTLNLPQYALTQKNYIQMADTLIPRAVAYSAGLINHFFRGRLDVTKVKKSTDTLGNAVVAITVKNTSAQNFAMANGKLSFFYDAIVDGTETRKLAQFIANETGEVIQLNNNEEVILSINLPTDIDPDKGNPFVVVYRGSIGVDPGVAGKVFNLDYETALLAWGSYYSDNTYHQLWRSTDFGKTWDTVTTPNSNIWGDRRIYPIGVGEAFATTLEYGTPVQNVYFTKDNGHSWAQVSPLEYDAVNKVKLLNAVPLGIDRKTDNMVLLSNHSIRKTNPARTVTYFEQYPSFSLDKGKTWTEEKTPIGLSFVYGFLVVDKDNILAMGTEYVGEGAISCQVDCYSLYHQYAIYHSTDYGRTWVKFINGSEALLKSLGGYGSSVHYESFKDTGTVVLQDENTGLFTLSVSSDIGQTHAYENLVYKQGNWLYAFPLYTANLGQGKMVAYTYDTTTASIAYTSGYYEGMLLTENYGQSWKEVTFRTSTGTNNAWPKGGISPDGNPSIGSLGVVTNDPSFFEIIDFIPAEAAAP